MGNSIRNKQQTKILTVSYKLFLESGYEMVTTRMIAESCGMTRALLHYYYDKKEKIIMDVYLDIVRESQEYFQKTLTPQQLDYLDVGMFFRLFYEMMSIKPSYANIYMVIYKDAELLNKLLKLAIEKHDFFGASSYSQAKQLGMFMVSGSLSQLILLYFNNELKMTLREVVNYAMRSYYICLGITAEEEYQKMIDIMDSIINEQYVKDFISLYEVKML